MLLILHADNSFCNTLTFVSFLLSLQRPEVLPKLPLDRHRDDVTAEFRSVEVTRGGKKKYIYIYIYVYRRAIKIAGNEN